jgi:hypothetical protein
LRKTSILTAAVTAAALTALTAGAALAGEWTGTGGQTPIRERANSICAFSGLNLDPGEEADGRTQSYGQGVRQGGVTPRFFNPGDACRGGSNTPEAP